MKFHFIFGLPPLEGVQIFLKDGNVLFGFNYSIKEAIVSKKSDWRAWREIVCYVININKKKERSKDGTLWHPWQYFVGAGYASVNHDVLEQGQRLNMALVVKESNSICQPRILAEVFISIQNT